MNNTELISELKFVRPLSTDGYFSDVYEGDDPIHGLVAVKIPKRLPGETDRQWQARKTELLQEGQRLKVAEDSRIVRVLHVVRKRAPVGEVQDEQPIYLVLEFCQGGSLLAEYKAGPLPLRRVRAIAGDVCLGMQVLHNRGMLHRDIKPGNILIDCNGRAKIGDFGLVTDQIAYGYASGAGYLDHLAPEYFTQDLTSQQTDVWAFGMTVYRLLHGHNWYTLFSPSPDLVQYGGYSDKLRWLPHIPRQWRRFVKRALHDDVDRRYHDFVEVAVGLQDLPTTPEWQCKVSNTSVTWQREARSNRFVVLWEWKSPLRHRWNAETVSLRSGRKRYQGSTAWRSPRVVIGELEAYFSSQK